jgi:hypothetical protein
MLTSRIVFPDQFPKGVLKRVRLLMGGRGDQLLRNGLRIRVIKSLLSHHLT